MSMPRCHGDREIRVLSWSVRLAVGGALLVAPLAAGAGAPAAGVTGPADPFFTHVAKLHPTPELDFSDARFGQAVAVDGDLMVVGIDDPERGEHAGAVHVFRRDQRRSSGWRQVAKLTAADTAEGDYFGSSVAISGDTVVVGAYGDDDHGLQSGSAYLFQRDHGGPQFWGLVAKIVAVNATAHAHFGGAVAISGGTVIVGAPEDDPDGSRSGSAYIFDRDTGGLDAWEQSAKIVPADSPVGAVFGWSVAISGDTAIVGADLTDDSGQNSGSAYIFARGHGNYGGWWQVAKLTAADAAAGDVFGRAVAIDGDTAVVGAPYADDYGDNSGAVYVFRRDEGGLDAWGQVAKISPADTVMRSFFGCAVGISGDTAVVGAYGDSDFGQGSGAAYVVTLGDGVFSDGFETGDTSAWSVTAP